MTDILYQPIQNVSDPVKRYLKKQVELRRAFEAYQVVSRELDDSWADLSADTQEWLANMHPDEYWRLRDSSGV